MNRNYLKYIITALIVTILSGFIIVCINVQNNQSFAMVVENDLKYLVINEVLADNIAGLKDEDGDYNDWIEIYNAGDEAIELNEFGLSDDLDDPFKWKFPDVKIEANSFLVIMASGKDKYEDGKYIHTNFKLNNKGDFIVLTNLEGETVDSIKIPETKSNVSFGRIYNNQEQYAILNNTTPGEPNKVSVIKVITPEKRLETPIFSKEGGFYEDTFYLELSVEDEETIIYYTLDGSEPTLLSYVYKEPIEITSRENEENRLSKINTVENSSLTSELSGNPTYKGTVIRARSYKNGVFSDEIITNTYFINPNYTLPIISLVTDEDNLFGYEEGIYVPGMIYDKWVSKNKNTEKNEDILPDTNYSQTGKEWEREAHIEFFEVNGERGISQNIGVRIAGGFSRANLCKSLSIYARTNYDSQGTIEYALFPGLVDNNVNNEELKSFKSFILRNSGNDFNGTMFKDALMQRLVENTGVETQAYRPSILFINGEYWGIHNIREKYSEYYFKSHYGIEKGDIAVLEIMENEEGNDVMDVSIGRGEDIKEYNEMIKFIEENDMADDENYKYIESKMDIDNFIKYTVSQIYFANWDWPQNNMKIWRKITKSDEPGEFNDGRWRWLLYDTDGGFNEYEENSLEIAINKVFYTQQSEDIESEDYIGKCLPLGKLLENEEFKSKFLDTFNNYLDTIFSTEYVVDTIREMASVIQPEMDDQTERWGMQQNLLGLITDKIKGKSEENMTWEEYVDNLVVFAEKRPEYIKKYLDDYFK